MIQLDTVQVIAVATLLGGVITVLFRTLVQSFEARIKDKQAEVDRAYTLAQHLGGQVGRTTDVVERAVSGLEKRVP